MDTSAYSTFDSKEAQQRVKEIGSMVEIKKNGYSWKSGRAYNPKADKHRQTEFKKEGIVQGLKEIDNGTVRIVFCDEMRYGLISNLRRAWTKRGKQRPQIPCRMKYEFGYLYIGVDSRSWEVDALLLPYTNYETTKVFIEFIRNKYKQEHLVIVWDGAGFHRAREVKEIRGVSFIELPSYSPELNPVERLIEELRKSTANKVFENLDQIEDKLIEALRHYINNPDKVQSLCEYPWIKSQLKSLSMSTS